MSGGGLAPSWLRFCIRRSTRRFERWGTLVNEIAGWQNAASDGVVPSKIIMLLWVIKFLWVLTSSTVTTVCCRISKRSLIYSNVQCGANLCSSGVLWYAGHLFHSPDATRAHDVIYSGVTEHVRFKVIRSIISYIDNTCHFSLVWCQQTVLIYS